MVALPKIIRTSTKTAALSPILSHRRKRGVFRDGGSMLFPFFLKLSEHGSRDARQKFKVFSFFCGTFFYGLVFWQGWNHWTNQP